MYSTLLLMKPYKIILEERQLERLVSSYSRGLNKSFVTLLMVVSERGM